MFFTSISQMMTESVDLTLVIRKANGQLTVSTLPKANGLKDEAANHIIPLRWMQSSCNTSCSLYARLRDLSPI